MALNNLDQKLLKPLDDMLRCRICSNFFNCCVMTSCSHNFCSACLKKRMETETDCPTCYEDIQEKELRSNRSMDKIVRIYKKLMKINATQPSELQHHLTQSFCNNSLALTSSVTQSASQTQNFLPLQISSMETVPELSASPIHNVQPDSQAMSNTSSVGTVPLIHSIQSQSQSSTSSSATASSIQNLEPSITLPVKPEIIVYDDSEMQDITSISKETNNSEDFHTKVLHLLKENCKNLEYIKKYIGEKDRETNIYTEIQELPCKSRQELVQFNTTLKDKAYFTRACRSLRTIGGINERDAIKRCLVRIMKNSVALQYNWRGIRGDKEPFVKLENILGLVFNASSFHYKTITREIVNSYIKEWLMRASDRDGGRKKRFLDLLRKENGLQ